MRPLKDSQIRYILSKRWKLYQLNYEELTTGEKAEYNCILKALNGLEVDELKFIATKYYTDAGVKKGIFKAISTKEVSEKLGVPVGTALKIEFRAMKNFKETYSRLLKEADTKGYDIKQ